MAHPWNPACSPPKLVLPVKVDPSGKTGPTKSQAAGRKWRRTSAGLHVPADTNRTLPEQRILEQSMRLPPGAGVTGWAGLRLFGAAFFDGLGQDGRTPLPVPLALGCRGRLRPNEQTQLIYERLTDSDLTRIQGIATTTLLRSAFDAVRLAPDDREATVALDMVLAAGRLSPQRLATFVAARPGWPRIARARTALSLCSEHSRSPAETRLRLVWSLDAGLPRPWVNCPIRSKESGRLLGIADLLDEHAGLVVEYDGADHRHAARHTKDVDREDLLRRHGLEVVRVTSGTLRRRSTVVDRLVAARERAKHLPEADRAWIAVPPRDDLEDQIAAREAEAGWREALLNQPIPSDEELRSW